MSVGPRRFSITESSTQFQGSGCSFAPRRNSGIGAETLRIRRSVSAVIALPPASHLRTRSRTSRRSWGTGGIQRGRTECRSSSADRRTHDSSCPARSHRRLKVCGSRHRQWVVGVPVHVVDAERASRRLTLESLGACHGSARSLTNLPTDLFTRPWSQRPDDIVYLASPPGLDRDRIGPSDAGSRSGFEPSPRGSVCPDTFGGSTTSPGRPISR